MSTTKTRLVFGFGYVGRRVATHWASADNERVFAVTRKPEKSSAISALQCEPIVADICDASALNEALSAALLDVSRIDSVLFAVGWDRSAHQTIGHVYVQGLKNVLAALHSLSGVEIGRFVYISSTGVFGVTDGSDVTESSECAPTRDGGKACLAAEQLLLQDAQLKEHATILRLAGIYGPERVPGQSRVIAGEPIATNPESNLNLIHVDDACTATLLASDKQDCAQLLLVSDGNPVAKSDYYGKVAQLSNLAAPKFEVPDSQTKDKGKKVVNNKMKRELAMELKFKSFEEGLKEIFRDV